MSVGIILSKIGVESVSALQGTLIRLFWGVIGLAFWGLATRQVGNWLTPFKDAGTLKLLLFAGAITIFGGFWLSLLALKYIDASLATILNSTTPLFILPMAALWLKERISFQAILGAVVAVSGVALIFLE